jgi:hypothetical protein
MLKTFFLAGGLIILFRLLITKYQNFEFTVTNIKSDFYRIIYNCIYYYSVCQLKYRKLCCYINPYLHYIYSSDDQYCKEFYPLLKSNSTNENKYNIYVSFYNNTALIKSVIYNNNSECEMGDFNLFIKNEEPMNYNLIIMASHAKQIESEQQSQQQSCRQNDMMIFSMIDNKNMLDFTNITNYEVSNIKFIAINLTYNNNTYQIQLKTPEYNFYIVDNIIGKTFFNYYLVNILKVVNSSLDSNFKYNLEIMDHNVNMFTLNENQVIIFKKDSYDIFQSNITREIVIEKSDTIIKKIDTAETSRY